LNSVTARIALVEGSTDALLANSSLSSTPFHLILSNLTYEDNNALLPDYMKLSRPGTLFAFAGILREKLDKMHAALEQHKLTLLEEEVGEMWAGLLAQRGE
jgi:ribosomal protein L11 methylase PrmA